MAFGVGEPVQKVDVGLTGVPETMLLTLHNRVSVAADPDGFFKDPKAVEIYESIDYDYERSFGKPRNTHAIRSMLFDEAILDFWKEHPDGTVINLAEGLETQRFRLEDEHQNQYKDAMWLSVDLPMGIEAREKFITADESHLHVSASALDIDSWAKEVPSDKPVLITAQGLFMYFERDEVKSLFEAISKKFPGATLMFDVIAKYVSDKTMKGWNNTEHYTVPEMPFGVNKFDAPPLVHSWVGDLEVEEIPVPLHLLPGVWGYLVPALMQIPVLCGYQPAFVLKVKFPAPLN